jgi:hypothetical protein
MKTTLASLCPIVAAFAGLLVASKSSACINGYHLPVAKRQLVPPPPPMPQIAAQAPGPLKIEVPKFELPVAPLPSKLNEEISASLARHDAFSRVAQEFEARPDQRKASFEDTTDYAVTLIHLGRHAEAIKVLIALEAKRPNAYTTAANLGTAYELAGELEAAAKWIAAGIERNAASHAGTEWLHLAILRAKIQLRSDPTWLARHSVLDLAERREPMDIVHAIEHQLNERLNFVTPLDAIVCDLFFQAALRLSGEAAKDRRAHYLSESLRYGDWRKLEAEALAKG